MIREIAVEEIRTLEQFEALSPEWWELWGRLQTTTPFQSPAWLVPWWRHFSPGELFTLAVRWRGRLVGLAPLYVEAQADGRRLLPVGISLSDYLDVLVDPGFEAQVGPSIMMHLARRSSSWDRLDWEELPPGAAALTLPSIDECDEVVQPQSACPVLTLRQGQDPLRATIPASKHRKLRMARNRAARHADTAVARVDSGTLMAFLESLADLHGARWHSRGETGILADATVLRFHQEAAPALLAAGLARFYTLQMGGRLAGAYYGFGDRHRAYAYLGGFDPAFSFESPGTILMGYAIEEALREGACEFHFLRGQESYKYEWAAADRWNWRRSVRRRRASSHD